MKKKGMRILAAALGVALAAGQTGGTGIFKEYPKMVLAAERSATVNATTLNVRSGPGTGNSIVKKLSYGTAVTVIGETTGSDGATWYQLRFTSGTDTLEGYASSQYIKFPTAYSHDSSFEAYLNQQGFPESYKDSLRTLHAEHPSWVFLAQHTGLDWNEVIQNESSVGANLVANSSISSWKSIEYGAYNWNTSSWTGFDGASWVAASKEIVCYYMDPRNFLNDIYVFQFLLHTYDGSQQTIEGLQSMISGTFLDAAVQQTESGDNSGNSGTGDSGTGSQGQTGGPGTSGTSGPGGSLSAGENAGPGYSGSGSGSGNVSAGTGGPGETSGNSGSQSGSSGSLTQVETQDVGLEGPGAAAASVGIGTVTAAAVPTVEYGPGMDASAITGDSTGQSDTAPVPTGESYAQIIMNAGAQTGVNPYVLAAMILQEQGDGTRGSISGKTSGYEGYYNFFNIGAYATESMSAVTRGLWYAAQTGSYGRPWNSIEKSIGGGASYYGETFVKAGQDTFYLKKFNVQGSNLYKHQYMTNVEGAAGEGAKLAGAYTDSVKNQALTFKIPVYNNMPETACAKPTVSGSPNNKLSSLEAEGYTLTPTFSMDTESYDIIVNPSVSQISVKASAIDSKASVSGTGVVNLQSGTNTVSVEVKAENGSVRTYRLNVVRQSDAPVVSVNPSGNGNTGSADGPGGQTSVQSGNTGGPGASQTGQSQETAGVEIGVGPGGTMPSETTAPAAAETTQTETAETAAPETTAPQTAAPSQTQAPETTAAQTTAAETAAAESQYALGDVNGDGSVTILDVVLIRKHILGKTTLTGASAKAADLNGDGSITAADADALQKKILG